MTCVARIVRMAIGFGCVATARAEEAALPGIFAPRSEPKARMEPPPLLRRGGTSERLTTIIGEKLQERARAFDGATLPVKRTERETPPVMLEKFVVGAEKVRKIEPPEKVSPGVRFLTTGRWFESFDGATTGDFRLFPAKPAGALPKEDVIRVEISITRKF